MTLNQIERQEIAKKLTNLSDKKRIALIELLTKEGIDPLKLPIAPAIRESNRFPLSWAQERMWFLDQLEGANATYNNSLALTMTGNINHDALRSAIAEIVRRHEVFRTRFELINGVPLQIVEPDINFEIEITDRQHLDHTQQQTDIEKYLQQEEAKPFNLNRGPLLRVNLVKLSATESMLLITMHHIISDGLSLGVFLKELSILYTTYSQGGLPSLPKLPIQYADFAVWQKQYLSGEVLETQLNYWKQSLANAPELLQLPTDRSRPTVQTYQGATYCWTIETELTEKLQNLSHENGTTLFMTMFAAFATLLYRYSGQSDILIGSPIANRNRSEIESLIGFFINTLVLRTAFVDNPSFEELLAQVKETTLKGYEHQDLPFEKVVEALQPQRSLSHSPLFQVMFNLMNTRMSKVELPGVNLSLIKPQNTSAKFDLTLSVSETESGLLNEWEYNTDLFDSSTIDRMAGHFQNLLSAIVENSAQKVSELPMLSTAENRQLLVEWNNTAVEYPQSQCIHKLFEQQVEKTPDAVAVVFEGEQLTYSQLNTKANQLAHYLQNLGVKPETLVGICVERSVEMVIGLLGILKAGAAYVPLDPSYPQQRIELILSDSQASILLTQKHLVATLPESQARVLCLDSEEIFTNQSSENLVSNVNDENLAYVIYTSGSTGKPKGVQIPHRNVVNFLLSMQQQPGITEEDVLLAVTTISFDIAGLEIYLPLITGAKVVLASRAVTTDGIELAKQISLSNVTVMQGTPATWQLLLASGWQGNQNLKILCGGEALPTDLARQLLNCGHSVWNLYGPTETTIWSTASQVEVSQLEKASIPIGRPIANTQLYILDGNDQPVPIGVSGELHIGGAGLARGYLNRPELTAEKFITIPLPSPLERGRLEKIPPLERGKPDKIPPLERGVRGDSLSLYKTGDLARYLPDGNIEYLGRIDNQVKLRGFRIELGEIESVLSSHLQVQQTVVICREDIPGNKQLVAYLVTSEPELNSSELRLYLQSKLPEYMLPSAFVLLETLPLTPNGKIDRKALPAPDINLTRSHEYVPPQTETEKQIATVLQEVLQLEKVSIYDNFFELGANSLILVKVNSKLREILSIELPLLDMFTYPNIKALSQHIIKKNETPEPLSELPKLEINQIKSSIKKRRKLRQKH